MFIVPDVCPRNLVILLTTVLLKDRFDIFAHFNVYFTGCLSMKLRYLTCHSFVRLLHFYNVEYHHKQFLELNSSLLDICSGQLDTHIPL